jgi:hypothetical protein
MLTVRPEQMKIFSLQETAKFEDWMAAHLQRFFPKWCSGQDENNVRLTIRYGIGRAAAHGLTAKKDVCKYIDHMAVFGRDFDTDKRYPWAARALNSKRVPSAKIRLLAEAAQKHLRGRRHVA